MLAFGSQGLRVHFVHNGCRSGSGATAVRDISDIDMANTAMEGKTAS